MVIVSEFSNGDEEENDALEQVNDSQRDEIRENDASEPVKDSPRNKATHSREGTTCNMPYILTFQQPMHGLFPMGCD